MEYKPITIIAMQISLLGCSFVAFAADAQQTAAENSVPPTKETIRAPLATNDDLYQVPLKTKAAVIIPDIPEDVMDTKAKTMFKRLPKDSRLLPIRAANIYGEAPLFTSLSPDSGLPLLDEIRVTAIREPEDYVAPKPAPMLVFRAKLDSIRPKTPWEIARALCIICPISGGPSEPSNIADRTAVRAQNPPSFANQR
jgi:hypothetical protein